MGACGSSTASPPGTPGVPDTPYGEDADAFKSLSKEEKHDSFKTKELKKRKDSVTEKAKERLKRSSSSINEAMVHLRVGKKVREFYRGVDDGPLLGKGNWGTVRVVTRKRDGSRFACKRLRISKQLSQQQLDELRNEIQLLSKVDHPFISKLYETYEEEKVYMYLIMELLEGGELYSMLVEQNKDGHYTEKKAVKYVQQMLSAVCYLHERGIVHRDLKLENFVFRDKKNKELVLIDFGLSKRYDDHVHKPQHMHDVVGSSYYIAPEVLKGDYGQECDLWSLGVIIFMFLSGTPPFAGEDEVSIMRTVLHGSYRMNAPIWAHVSNEAKDFIAQCLERDTKKRITAAAALKHPWIAKLDKDHKTHPLGASVVANLEKFGKFTEFKRIAMQAVAFSLSHDEIAKLEKQFEEIDIDHDGFVTYEEFKLSVQKTCKNKSETELHELFDAIDIDHTGKVHRNEFIAAALNAKHYYDEATLMAAFQSLDIDEEHSGTIGIEDLASILGKQFAENHANEILSEFLQKSRVKKNERIHFKQFIQHMRDDHNDSMGPRRRSHLLSISE